MAPKRKTANDEETDEDSEALKVYSFRPRKLTTYNETKLTRKGVRFDFIKQEKSETFNPNLHAANGFAAILRSSVKKRIKRLKRPPLNRRFTCLACDNNQSYDDYQAYETHILNTHGKRCEPCRLTFKTLGGLKNHESRSILHFRCLRARELVYNGLIDAFKLQVARLKETPPPVKIHRKVNPMVEKVDTAVRLKFESKITKYIEKLADEFQTMSKEMTKLKEAACQETALSTSTSSSDVKNNMESTTDAVGTIGPSVEPVNIPSDSGKHKGGELLTNVKPSVLLKTFLPFSGMCEMNDHHFSDEYTANGDIGAFDLAADIFADTNVDYDADVAFIGSFPHDVVEEVQIPSSNSDAKSNYYPSVHQSAETYFTENDAFFAATFIDGIQLEDILHYEQGDFEALMPG